MSRPAGQAGDCKALSNATPPSSSRKNLKEPPTPGDARGAPGAAAAAGGPGRKEGRKKRHNTRGGGGGTAAHPTKPNGSPRIPSRSLARSLARPTFSPVARPPPGPLPGLFLPPLKAKLRSPAEAAQQPVRQLVAPPFRLDPRGLNLSAASLLLRLGALRTGQAPRFELPCKQPRSSRRG